MRARSIRFRLTLWYAAALTAALGLFGALLWLSLRHQLTADLERDLEGRGQRFESFFRTESAEPGAQLLDELQEFCQGLPPGSYIDVRGSKGFAFHYPAGPTASAAEFRVQQRAFAFGGEVFHLEVGAAVSDLRHVLDLLRLLLWSLLPVVIAVACLGGAWLSGQALKPVEDVTNAALNISIENLSGRLPVPATGDEIARLAGVLNSMLARLETAVNTLSQFVADASHELRTPLAVIRTTAELALRRERSPDAYPSALDEIAGASERMTQLIEDLLVLARSDASAVEMPREAVDLREILSGVSKEMENLAQAAGIRVITDFGDRPTLISGNRQGLHRLFMVLLDNAVKYSRAGGRVNLSLTSRDGLVSAIVEDFGAGIPPADLPHIFRRFYQADRARTAGGHGLGLSLAETIARTHGVRIEVRSSPGEGSIFRVVFPERAVNGPAVSALQAAPDAEALAGS